MQSKRLIGITGHIKAGKTTAANHLTSRGYVEVSFADPLKKACKDLFLFTDEQVYGTQEQKETPDERWFGCTPRKALQFIGSDLLRDNLDKIMPGLGKNVFVHHFKLWFESNPTTSVVIHDLRFLNEAAAIKDLGGIIIRIKRKEADEVNHSHQSEKEIDLIDFDYCIENDFEIEGLKAKLDEILN